MSVREKLIRSVSTARDGFAGSSLTRRVTMGEPDADHGVSKGENHFDKIQGFPTCLPVGRLVSGHARFPRRQRSRRRRRAMGCVGGVAGRASRGQSVPRRGTVCHVSPRWRRRHGARLLRRRRRLQSPLLAAGPRLVAVRNAEQPAGVERQERFIHRWSAVGEAITDRCRSSRRSICATPTARPITSSAPPATPGCISRASCRSRRSRRSPPRRSTRSASASFPKRMPTTRTNRNGSRFQGGGRQVRLQPARSGVLAAFRAAHPGPAAARHRGGPHSLASLRPLGIRRHERRGGRPLSALLHRPALGLPQRLVVAGQRVRFHDRPARRAIAATSSGRTGTGSSRSSRRKTRTSGCAAFTTAASGTTTRRTGSRTPASRPPT